VRDADGLGEALAAIERLTRALATTGVGGGRAFNTAWQDWLNVENQLTAARLIAASALERRESRGAHHRSDFPEPDPAPTFTVRVRERDGQPTLWREPVAFTRMEMGAARLSMA
jgi:succinate dehydrogenase/fumarate reductase flavoprotein subunit